MATSETKSKLEEGPCGRFRFQVIPDPITVGVLFLERKRPWPKCTNPETGKQWGDDMKQKVSKIPKKRLIVEIPYMDYGLNIKRRCRKFSTASFFRLLIH